jgi:putative ribosome biogenesis GTPase RsgA
LVATLKRTQDIAGFIDRSWSRNVSCKAIIVFNKADLFKKKDQENLRKQEMYVKAGYKVFLTSTKENTGIEELQEELKDKTSLMRS